MFCPACGLQCRDGARFCANCGGEMPVQEEMTFASSFPRSAASTVETNRPESEEAVNEPTSSSSPKRKFNWSLVVILVLGALLVASLITQSHILQSTSPGSGVKAVSEGKANTEPKVEVGIKPPPEVKPKPSVPPSSMITQTAPQIIQQERRSSLMAADTVVEPGHWFVKTFVVTSDMLPTTLAGSFRASGGMGNDIKVFVADDEGWINTQNHHETLYYYHSGQVTVGSFNLLLKPGRYHLVFDNTFSMMANKIVHSDIVLTYQERR